MKKFLGMLLAVLLLCGAAIAEDVDYTGLWVMTGGEVNGQSYTAEQLQMEVSMELLEGGACTLTISGEAEEGTWAVGENGVTVTDSTEVAQFFALQDGNLVAEEEGMKMIFARGGDAAFYVDTWILISLEANGQTIDPLSQGLDMSVQFNADGTCVLYASGMEDLGTWAVTSTGVTSIDSTGVEDVYTLQDGKLVAVVEGINLVFCRESEAAMLEEAQTELPVPEEYLYAVPLSGVEAAAFDGTWTLSWANVMNQNIYGKEDLGMNIEIQLQGGMGYVKEVYASGTDEYFGVTQTDEIADVGTVLYLFFVDEKGEQNGNGMVFFLFDSDQLVWEAQYSDGSWILYYFERVVAEAAPAEEASAEVPAE